MLADEEHGVRREIGRDADDAAALLIDFQAEAMDVVARKFAAAGEEDAERGVMSELHTVVGQGQ